MIRKLDSPPSSTGTPDERGAVVIGASAGAVEALLAILPHLPRDFPQPILVVVHLPPDRPSKLPDLIASRCRLRVKEAEDKEPISASTVYFAPPNYHLLVEPDYRMALSNEEPVLWSRPAIDVLFESAADVYGSSLTAVVLSGANHDGAAGLRKVCDAGGRALVQKPGIAVARAMPDAALHRCPEAIPLDFAGILRALNSNFSPQSSEFFQ